jgi:exonuclease SbcD
MTRLAITADLHVDTWLTRRHPPERGGLNVIEQDRLDTLRWVGEHARAFGCEALVVAGDFVERKTNPRSGRVTRIAQALRAGPDRQIFLPGNHDIADAGLSIVDDLATRSIDWTGHTRPDVIAVGDVAVCVIPFLSPAWLRTQTGCEDLPDADVFRILGEQYLTLARGLYAKADHAGMRSAILVGHQQLSGGRMNETQQAFLGDLDLVVDARALAAIGFAAVTFGHVHRGQTVIADPACPVVFTGSVERVDFAEELEEKSFLVVDVENGRATLERVPTPARHMVTVRGDGSFVETAVEDSIVRGVDLDPEVDEADLRRALYAAGALEVMGIRRRTVAKAALAGGLAEDLSPEQLLEAYFAGDPDRDDLVAIGRRILAEVA